ncbi:conserved hypothetical protein [Tenacibaculum sp. 190524A05c]
MKEKLLIILVLSSSFIFSQSKIDSNYVNYFKNTREVPFLHLNKTSFLLGEEIWFNAYVQEQNSRKLHTTTSNLYVSIFNNNGTLKDQQLIHIKNGLGHGSILLDSTYTEQHYHIKASTRWMKNFNEDNAFYQKIKIISKNNKKYSVVQNEKDAFEYKLFPEGGHLIANAINSIGILIKDKNNKGLKIEKGIIRDQQDNIIRQFTTNELGMNSVRLFVKENEIYRFSILLSNGKELNAYTPKPDSKGITLNVVNKNSDKVALHVISNKNTVQELHGKRYRIMIHNTRKFRNFYFSFNHTKQNYFLPIPKEELFPGINIVTVFNEEDQPITERLTYLHSEELFHELKPIVKKASPDSLKITFTNPTKDVIYSSASFLPSTTKAYNPQNNIMSAFILKPYIKGEIEDVHSLFDHKKDSKLRRLDLLLLTQGWSKYKWNNIFNNPSKTIFPFENGIDLTAKFNSSISSKQSILLFSKENNLVHTIQPNENPWTFKNSFIKKKSTIEFGVNKDDRITRIAPALSFSGGTLLDRLNKEQSSNEVFVNEFETSNFKPLKGEYETLNEVEVRGIKDKNVKEDPEIGGYRKIDMEKAITNSGMDLIEFIISKTPPFKPISRVELNGRNVIREPWLLKGVYLDQVKSVHYGTDIQVVLGQPAYAFFIFTYSNIEMVRKNSSTSKIKMPVGFATEKEYYSPKYPSLSNDTFKQYGAIFWKPNIELGSETISSITIPISIQKNITTYIEGITSSGKLISQKVILKTD